MLILVLFVGEYICGEPLTEGVYGFVMCSCHLFGKKMMFFLLFAFCRKGEGCTLLCREEKKSRKREAYGDEERR